MFIRLILGFPFVYLISGFPLARLFLPEEKQWSLKLLLTSFAFSLLLTYPAAVLTTMIEGQSAQAIYSIHLPTSLFSLGLFSLASFLILVWRNKKWSQLSLPKFSKHHFLLLGVVLVYALFVFYNLGRADALGDDYDLVYQAYNLDDGVFAARKAYIISFTTHPPLMMTIKHFGLQLFTPYGLETLQDWMFRGVEGMMGIGIILAAYLLVRDFLSKREALLTAAILAVNNYLIFFGRYFEREIYLTFFLVISTYFFLKKKWVLSAVFFGAGFLVKFSALTLLPVVIFFFLRQKKIRRIFIYLGIIFVIYFPVIVYNVGAYYLTGYMDSNFSRIFNLPHPYLPPVDQRHSSFVPLGLTYLLSDLYSWPVLAFFSVATFFILVKRFFKQEILLFLFAWLLVSCAFFSFSSVLRAYYLVSLTIPLAIFAAVAIFRVRRFRLALAAVTVFILLWSAYYSFRTNLLTPKLSFKYDDVGVSGDYNLFKNDFWIRNFSLAAASFSQERGWKNLAPKLSNIYTPNSCLQLASGVGDLPVRRYLGTDDLVKEILLGKNYPHHYLMCSEVVSPTKKIELFYDSSGQIKFQVL